MRKVTDIDWDTDGKDIDLPSEVELTKYVPEKRITECPERYVRVLCQQF